MVLSHHFKHFIIINSHEVVLGTLGTAEGGPPEEVEVAAVTGAIWALAGQDNFTLTCLLRVTA